MLCIIYPAFRYGVYVQPPFYSRRRGKPLEYPTPTFHNNYNNYTNGFVSDVILGWH